jgi:hypothetical protein
VTNGATERGIRHVIVKPWRQSKEQKSRLAEQIAQAGRTGLMEGLRAPKTPRRSSRKRSGGTKDHRHKVENKRKHNTK